ncbi:MAG: 6-bladed beta-propeller, partial [Acidobacteriales bacterium]
MKYLLSIIYIFCVCNSCTRETNSEYKKINSQINNYQDFKVNVIKSILLETKDESLVGSISKLYYVDQKIYILDFNNKSILCFSDSSKFLYRINFGRGPGELIDPIDFAIVDSSLLVVDQNMFKVFDLHGNFINKVPFMNGLYCWKLNFIKDSTLLLYGNTPSINDLKKMESDKSIKIENIYSQYKLIDNALSKELKSFLPISFNLRSCMCEKPMTVYEDHILCLSPPTNHIYEYKNRNMKLKYEINFNRKGFTKDDIKKGEKYLIRIL